MVEKLKVLTFTWLKRLYICENLFSSMEDPWTSYMRLAESFITT